MELRPSTPPQREERVGAEEPRKRRKIAGKKNETNVKNSTTTIGRQPGSSPIRQQKSKVPVTPPQQESNTPFPFMRLPPEVRNIVYRKALVRDTMPLYVPVPGELSRPEPKDGISRALLLVSRQVKSEARKVLYSENHFELNFDNAVHALEHLGQGIRSLIHHIQVTIPQEYHDNSPRSHDTEKIANLARVGLRYCFHLQDIKMILPECNACDPAYQSHASHPGYLHDLPFHLRYLPQGCKIQLAGPRVCERVMQVVEQAGRLKQGLDQTN